MRRKNFVVAKAAFSIFVDFINVIFCNVKKKIKSFVHNRENDILTKFALFSQRLFNKQRRFLLSAMFEREQFTKNSFINESINNCVKTTANQLFFLF